MAKCGCDGSGVGTSGIVTRLLNWLTEAEIWEAASTAAVGQLGVSIGNVFWGNEPAGDQITACISQKGISFWVCGGQKVFCYVLIFSYSRVSALVLAWGGWKSWLNP